MILLWFLTGLALALLIARLNESNKLFWIAFTSFAFGIAVESIVHKMDQSKDDLAQVCPMQAVVDTSNNAVCLLADDVDTTRCLVPNPAGQDTTPGTSEENFTLNKSFKETPTEPPETKKLKNDNIF